MDGERIHKENSFDFSYVYGSHGSCNYPEIGIFIGNIKVVELVSRQ